MLCNYIVIIEFHHVMQDYYTISQCFALLNFVQSGLILSSTLCRSLHIFQIYYKSKIVKHFLSRISELYIYFRYDTNLKWLVLSLSHLPELTYISEMLGDVEMPKIPSNKIM